MEAQNLRMYNRMEDNFHLANKKALFYNLQHMYTALGEDPFESIPVTFHIQNGTRDPEFTKFLCFYERIAREIKEIKKEIEASEKAERAAKAGDLNSEEEKKSPSKKKRKKRGGAKKHEEEEAMAEEEEGIREEEEEEEGEAEQEENEEERKMPHNIWIIKPGENTNQGHGIMVCSNLNEIKSTVGNSGSSKRTYILQRYIDRPLLIHRRKFDMRVYGLLTGVNGHLKGYFFEDGYLRTSSKEF